MATQNTGASKERAAIKAHVIRLRRSVSSKFPEAQAILDKLIAWLQPGRRVRTGQRAGGLGRK